uniref:Putative RNA-binding protein n=2 Tax=environmental samples TaxID=68359 RepID=A0A075HUH4_9EURY|nr:putative RNA-binding protein [uncultured marine group II/III euryarchaeote KM3_187_D06]AIF18052.1 putative RNA-binding protein [uncultured marine group II/III euryarchaeote KM3_80_H04]
MTNTEKKLRKQALNPSLEVTIRVGKSGLTESVVDELDSQLKSRTMVKAKLNRGLADDSADRQNLWQMLAEQTSSKLILMRGNIAVFYR